MRGHSSACISDYVFITEHLSIAHFIRIASFVIAGGTPPYSTPCLESKNATGQVAANADIVSAVHPAWRTARTHVRQILFTLRLWN
jgi:hypothetical protein